MNIRKSLTAAVLALVALPVFSQERFPLCSYEELPQFVKADPGEWKDVKGLQWSWGDKDVRYAGTGVPAAASLKRLKLKGWRGERVFAQAVVWTSREVKGLSYEMTDLKGKGGAVIPASACETGFVRYVMADELNKDGQGGCGDRSNHALFDSSLVADCIDPYLKSMHMKPMQTQGIWLTCWIPGEVPAGVYRGSLDIQESGKTVGTLGLEVQVEDKVLPEPSGWAFHLDLWQNPFAVARYYGVPLWSREHLDAMRPLMTRLAQAGQKVITTSIMHKPWNGQTEDPFESMVTWIRKVDGSWEYKFDVFDRWVEFMTGCGVTGQINCYSMVPWRLSFQYFDQASDALKEIHAEPGEQAYEDLWAGMLSAFSRHLKEKGWFEKTAIAMDERPMETMRKVIGIIRKADPDFKISLAGNYYPEIEKEIFDYCVGLRSAFPDDVLARRKFEGKFSTYYTCCAEPSPNTFTFSPLEEASFIGREMAARKSDGYLRWAYNSWPLQPLLDSRFRSWASGDTYLVYPGNRTSLRFEHLVEGIQAFEKTRLLNDIPTVDTRIDPDEAAAYGAVLRAEKKLIAFDLDATLTQHKTPISPRNRALLDSLAKRYSLVMVGGGGCERIYHQMLDYPIDILGNYGMEESAIVDGRFKIIRDDVSPVDKGIFTEKTQALREKYGYATYCGDPLEFHESGMVTFGLLGTKAPGEEKLAFDPDRKKRQAMLADVQAAFPDYAVFIGGTTSFDIAPKQYNKYDATLKYAAEHGFTKDQVLFVGDDFGDGGNDSHIRLRGMDYVQIYDFTTVPERLAFLLK